MPEECYSEMKKAEAVHGLLSAMESSSKREVMKCDDFSSFLRLINITSLVLKSVTSYFRRYVLMPLYLMIVLRPKSSGS